LRDFRFAPVREVLRVEERCSMVAKRHLIVSDQAYVQMAQMD